jgi:hypothetical protein
LLLAYLLWGTATLLESLASSSSLVEHVQSTLTILGTIGACGILWAQAVWVRRGI